MKQFINSMLSEGGKVSHKRFISTLFAINANVIAWWGVVKYKEVFMPLFYAILLFILIMSGVATLLQVISLVRGTPVPKDETKPNE